jgi:DNA-binding CsgD family transcriptional regulator
MTRNKAAEALGVTPQTISNYVKEGILGGFIGIKNTLYVNADDIDKYLKKYRFIAVKEEMIDRKLREQKDRENEINDRLADTRKELLGAKSYKTPSAIILAKALFRAAMIPRLSTREMDIIDMYIEGESLQEIADVFSLTSTRVNQILAKALRKFTEQTGEITANLRENSELEAEIHSLKLSVAALKKEYNDYRLSHGDTEDENPSCPPEILLKSIDDCGFSIRIVIALKWTDIYDVNGLVTRFYRFEDILKIRNIGRGSLCEIRNFMDEHNLVFIRPGESLSQFYRRLDLNITMSANSTSTN